MQVDSASTSTRPPRRRDLLGALQAVVAHAGQHDEHRALAERARGVGDRQVGARAQAADLGRVAERRHAGGGEAQVRAAGREQRDARVEHVAVAGLAHAQARGLVEPVRERRR